MRQPWRFRQVRIALPVVLVRTMFDRARKYDRDEGGRFDARKATVVLWSGPACAESARPVGSFSVHWGDPAVNKATIYRIGWDEAGGGSLGEVCQAVELLAGTLVAR